MALDATVGSPDANSYVTVAEAAEYFANRTHASSWENVDNPSAALITASSMLDWYIKWKGYRSSTTQSMQWPRTGVIRPDTTEVAIDVIPPEVKIAVYELALSSIDVDRTADDALAGIEQVKAGSLMIKADSKDSDSTHAKAIPDKINRILSDLTTSGSIGVVRLVRG